MANEEFNYERQREKSGIEPGSAYETFFYFSYMGGQMYNYFSQAVSSLFGQYPAANEQNLEQTEQGQQPTPEQEQNDQALVNTFYSKLIENEPEASAEFKRLGEMQAGLEDYEQAEDELSRLAAMQEGLDEYDRRQDYNNVFDRSDNDQKQQLTEAQEKRKQSNSAYTEENDKIWVDQKKPQNLVNVTEMPQRRYKGRKVQLNLGDSEMANSQNVDVLGLVSAHEKPKKQNKITICENKEDKENQLDSSYKNNEQDESERNIDVEYRWTKESPSETPPSLTDSETTPPGPSMDWFDKFKQSLQKDGFGIDPGEKPDNPDGSIFNINKEVSAGDNKETVNWKFRPSEQGSGISNRISENADTKEAIEATFDIVSKYNEARFDNNQEVHIQFSWNGSEQLNHKTQKALEEVLDKRTDIVIDNAEKLGIDPKYGNPGHRQQAGMEGPAKKSG